MSAAVLVFMTFVTAGVLVLVGWQLHGLVLEIWHDCLPHDPKRCTLTTTKNPEGTS